MSAPGREIARGKRARRTRRCGLSRADAAPASKTVQIEQPWFESYVRFSRLSDQRDDDRLVEVDAALEQLRQMKEDTVR